MNFKIKKLFVLILLLTISFSTYAHEISFQKKTPFFSKPNIKSQIISVNENDLKLKSLEEKSTILDNHPLVRKIKFHKVLLGKNKIAVWASPNLELSKIENKSIILPRKIINNTFTYMQYILLFLLTTLLLFLFYVNFIKTNKPKSNSLSITVALISILIILRLILVCFILSRTNGLFTYPADENSYTQIANDIFNLDFSNIANWSYAYGYSLFLLPILWLFKTGSYYSLIQEISFYNCFIISSVNIILLFFIIKKLGNSNYKAFLVQLCIIIFSFTFLSIENWPIKFFTTVFNCSGVWSTENYGIYNMFHNINYVGLSHVVSSCIFYLAILLTLYLSPKIKLIIIVSALFALAFLVRIDTIFFSPLIAFLFWTKFKYRIKSDYLFLLKIVIISVAVFAVVALPQLIINYTARNNIFASPYELHAIAQKAKWTLETMLSYGINFQISLTLIYVVLGLTGLLFVKNKQTKNILILWAIPFYIFYCGFACSGNNPVRFVQITFSASIGAFIICEIWNNLKFKESFLLIVSIILNIIFISPRNQYLQFYIKPNMSFLLDYYYVYNTMFYTVIIFSLLSFAYIYKVNKRAAYFLLTFLILYLTANPYFIFIIMIALYINTLFFWLKDILATLMIKKDKTTLAKT